MRTRFVRLLLVFLPLALSPGCGDRFFGTLAGTVRDEAGRPIAGARISVDPQLGLPPKILKQFRAQFRAQTEGTTSNEGTFVLYVRGFRDSCRLLVEAPGRGRFYVPNAVPNGPPLEIVLRPEARVGGTVVARESGKPIPGANVEASLQGFPSGFLAPVETDSTGNWEVAGLPGGVLILRIQAPGRVPSRIREIPISPSGSTRIDVLLDPASALTGKITGPDGEPLSSAWVYVVPEAAWEADFMDLSASTNRDGLYSIENLPPGKKGRVLAGRSGFASRVDTFTSPPPGERRTFDIELQRGGSLEGTVLDEDGEPVRGAVVRLEMPDGFWWHSYPLRARLEEYRDLTPVGKDGRFGYENIPAGEWKVIVEAAGKRRDPGLTIRIEEGKRIEDQIVRLKMGAPLRGRVVDDAGEGVRGADVHAFCEGMQPGNASTRTAPDGTFLIRGLECRRYRLSVDSPAFPVTVRKNLPPTANELRIQLERNGSVSGKVILPGGVPASVVTVEPAPVPGQREEGIAQARWKEPMTFGTEDGRYTLDGLEPGLWDIAINAPGMLPTLVEDVKVEPGRTTGGVDAALLPGAVLTGTVVRAGDGMPVPGAEVVGGATEAANLYGNRTRAVTDLGGVFRLEGLAPGATTLYVTHPDRASAFLDGVQVPGNLRIELPAGGCVEATVLDTEGAPAGNQRVYLSPSRNAFDDREGMTDAGGRFTAPHLPAGGYSVSVSLSSPTGYLGFSKGEVVDVRDGETTRVTLRPKARRVSGHLIRDGKPLASARLGFLSSTGSKETAFGWVKTGEDGSYEIRGIPPGDYELSIRESDWSRTATARISVPADPTVERDIVLPPMISISGRVVDAGTGEGQESASLVVRQERNRESPFLAGRRVASIWSGAGGAFGIEVQEPGAYRVTPGADDYPRQGPVRLEVPPRGIAGLLIHVTRKVDRFHGRIVDGSGRSVNGAEVTAIASDPVQLEEDRATTRASGRFALEVPAGRAVDLCATAPHLAPACIRGVTATGREIVIALPEGETLELQLLAPTEIRRWMSVRLLDGSGLDLPVGQGTPGAWRSLVDDDLAGSGRIVYRHLAPGAYTIVATAGDKSASARAVVEEGKPARVTVGF